MPVGDSTDHGKTVIGLDLGATTTKTVAVRGGALVGSITTTGDAAAGVAHEAVERLISSASLALETVRCVAVTGVRAASLSHGPLRLPIRRIDEFRAIGRGGLHLSGLPTAIVVSMGTGTAIVAAGEGNPRHLGGTALGGGTLRGLAQRILGTDDVDGLVAIAASGSLERVDLTVGDIAGAGIGGLGHDITASNFGKLDARATAADLALGLINLVVQNIALMAAFAARVADLADIVLTGKVALLPQVAEIVGRVGDLTGARFTIPEAADYATAVGAALCPPDE